MKKEKKKKKREILSLSFEKIPVKDFDKKIVQILLNDWIIFWNELIEIPFSGIEFISIASDLSNIHDESIEQFQWNSSKKNDEIFLSRTGKIETEVSSSTQ